MDSSEIFFFFFPGCANSVLSSSQLYILYSFHLASSVVSSGLVPVCQCLLGTRKPKTGHSAPNVVSQVLNGGMDYFPGLAG